MKFARISFFARRISGKPEGSIYCRIRVDGSAEDIALGIKVPLAKWDAKKYVVKEATPAAVAANAFIETTRTRLNVLFNEISRGPNADKLSAQYLRAVYEGKAEQKKTVMQLMKEVVGNKQLLSSKGSLSPGTLVQYDRIITNLPLFLKATYQVEDLILERITHQGSNEFHFAKDYLNWMREKKWEESTVYKEFILIKSCFTYAVTQGYISVNPFGRVDIKRPLSGEYKYLSEEEMEKLKTVPTEDEQERVAKNIFLFSCYTGLSYIDLMNLKTEHIFKGVEKFDWIFIGRQKTKNSSKQTCEIPLFPEALELMQSLSSTLLPIREGYIVPHFSNGTLNYILDRLRLRAKLYDKKISMHVARHTFTVWMLEKGFSFDAVAAMLGHSSSVTTRKIYGEITPKRIVMEMNTLQIIKPILGSEINTK